LNLFGRQSLDGRKKHKKRKFGVENVALGLETCYLSVVMTSICRLDGEGKNIKKKENLA